MSWNWPNTSMRLGVGTSKDTCYDIGKNLFICLLLALVGLSEGQNCPYFITELQKWHSVDFPEDRYELTCFPNEQKCILTVYLEKTYQEARLICAQLTGYLWIPPEDWIIGYDSWIGLTGYPIYSHAQEMVWITDRQSLPDHWRWAKGYVEFHEDAYCAVLRAGPERYHQWEPMSCNRTFFFYCAFEGSSFDEE
ncbi:hypothetical protein D915_000388 [Fasciola hepatica]|uniref:C-type lectin domain-containing protein n=1 Tax=Fasciola hepatica TaxID=6192 RepID=A0A4E0RLF6_FASHE|nr:hypothetical protein D915_000388 [Fasciola hepatica]